MKRIWTIVILGFCATFFGCMPEEIAVPEHESGDVITASVDMETDYRWQIYYSLENNAIVGQNLKTDWDLAFESGEEDYHVHLNSSKMMFALNTQTTDFSSVTDTLGFENNKQFDMPSGYSDSTAIGEWKDSAFVFIIDRGYNEVGIHQGFRKIQFQSVTTKYYQVRFANLDGSNEISYQIDKDSLYNFQFLSFSNNKTEMIEPSKTTWDISFTQYTEALSIPYLVTGVRLNAYLTNAYKDDQSSFDAIAYDNLDMDALSANQNVIGYDWKYYDFDAVSYIVYSNFNYVIKDSKGYFYKLRFIDFYNENGKKGAPTWEHQRL